MHTNNDAYLALDGHIGYVPAPQQDPAAWVPVLDALLDIAYRAEHHSDPAAITTMREVAAGIRQARGENTPQPPVAESEDEHDHRKHLGDPCYGYLDHDGCTGSVETIVTFADPDHGPMTIAVCGAHHARLSSDTAVEIQFVSFKHELVKGVA